MEQTTPLLQCLACRLHGRSLAVQPNCVNGVVLMSGTVYRDMHFKDLLGSIVKEGYRILVPNFYLVLHIHGLKCRKKKSNGLIN